MSKKRNPASQVHLTGSLNLKPVPRIAKRSLDPVDLVPLGDRVALDLAVGTFKKAKAAYTETLLAKGAQENGHAEGTSNGQSGTGNDQSTDSTTDSGKPV